MTDSDKLLRDYVETGSESSFRELVARYLDLVYSAAVRLMEGDTHGAEDVAQTVLGDLARMAGTLSPEVMLGGWLHRRTCHVAARLDAPTITLLPAANWANVGTATPEATWQTLRWAFAKHDTGAFTQAVAWDPEIEAKAKGVFDAAPESARQRFGSVEGVLYAMMATPGFSEQNVTGFGVVSQSVSGDQGTLIVQEQHPDGTVRQNPIQMHRFDDGWRVLTPPKMVDVLGRYLNNPQLWATDSSSSK